MRKVTAGETLWVAPFRSLPMQAEVIFVDEVTGLFLARHEHGVSLLGQSDIPSEEDLNRHRARALRMLIKNGIEHVESVATLQRIADLMEKPE